MQIFISDNGFEKVFSPYFALNSNKIFGN